MSSVIFSIIISDFQQIFINLQHIIRKSTNYIVLNNSYSHCRDYIENLEENTTQLKIYFVKFQKILQRDLLFSTVSLIGNDIDVELELNCPFLKESFVSASFGGIYSLFMGCSLITVCEIIYYCTLRVFVKKHISKKIIGSDK